MKGNRVLKMCLVIIISLCVPVSFTFAQDTDHALVDTYDLKFGPNLRYLKYEETNTDVSLEGGMAGVSGEFTYHGISKMDNYLMAGLELDILGGSPDYDDQSASYSSNDNWLIETRGLIGYEYLTDEGSVITPFTGIGYLFWNNKYYDSPAYQREVQRWYVPIGIKSWGSLSKNWSGGMTAELDIFLDGKTTFYQSDVDSSLNDPEVDHDYSNGYGARLSVHFTRDFASRGHSLTFEPYISYRKTDRSENATLTSNGSPVGSVYDPESETTSVGMRLSLSF